MSDEIWWWLVFRQTPCMGKPPNEFVSAWIAEADNWLKAVGKVRASPEGPPPGSYVEPHLIRADRVPPARYRDRLLERSDVLALHEWCLNALEAERLVA